MGLGRPWWQVWHHMFTRLSPLGSIFFRWSLISPSMRYISRARFLLGFSSEAKSKVLSGLPSSPLWQYEQRTPSARVNPTITGRRRVPDQSLGKTWRFFGFSGQVHLSCARAGRVNRAVTERMYRNLVKSRLGMKVSSKRSGKVMRQSQSLESKVESIKRKGEIEGGIERGTIYRAPTVESEKAARQQHESRRYLESAWVSFLRGPGA